MLQEIPVRRATLKCLCRATVLLALLGAGPAALAQTADELFFPEQPEGAKPEDYGDAPTSVEELFKTDAGAEGEAGEAESVEDLFGTSPLVPPSQSAVTGFFQNEIAYVYADDEHWQKFRNTLQLATKGSFDWGRWYASARVVYDPIYDWTDYYPDDVRDDQRFEATLRETYVDIPAGKWDFRLGRQHIIWGEMVGLFFADVVSAKDQREFILQDFDLMRIPQWAVRAEYFEDEFHGELIWIPVMTYDDIGEPGSDYFPFDADKLIDPSLAPAPLRPVFRTRVDAGKRPADSLENSAFGMRFNWLKNGWDTSVFYYTSLDATPAFERRIFTQLGGPPGNPVVTDLLVEFEGIHERIHQVGGTVAKDFGNVVFKGEWVYTEDRLFSVTRLADADGLVELDTLDYALGLDYNFAHETNFNVQFFQRYYTDYDDDIAVPETERADAGFSLYLETGYFHPDVTPEVILISSLERDDWLLQAKVTWAFQKNWRLVGGADIFDGPDNGVFGRFDDTDRVYTEVRYTF